MRHVCAYEFEYIYVLGGFLSVSAYENGFFIVFIEFFLVYFDSHAHTEKKISFSSLVLLCMAVRMYAYVHNDKNLIFIRHKNGRKKTEFLSIETRHSHPA